MIEGAKDTKYPATYLQDHGNTTFVLEQASATNLVRYKAPWLLENQGLKGEQVIEYNLHMTKKAVIWLSLKVQKPILRLVLEDYEDNGLLELVT